MIRLVVADDHALMRSGMRVMLEAEDDMRVVEEAADGRAAVEAVRRTVPDVLVTDLRMPGLDGIEATRQIVAAGLPTRVLMITTFDLDRYVYAGSRRARAASCSRTPSRASSSTRCGRSRPATRSSPRP